MGKKRKTDNVDHPRRGWGVADPEEHARLVEKYGEGYGEDWPGGLDDDDEEPTEVEERQRMGALEDLRQGRTMEEFAKVWPGHAQELVELRRRFGTDDSD